MGLVLGGGGARGAAHVGMIKAIMVSFKSNEPVKFMRTGGRADENYSYLCRRPAFLLIWLAALVSGL